MIVTGAWGECPYQHPEGWGHCTLLDSSMTHRDTDGHLRHLCDPQTGTRRPTPRRLGDRPLILRPGYVVVPASKRDRERWIRREAGQPTCPRLSPQSGATCLLIDDAGLHERGHDGVDPITGSHVGWPPDQEDWLRWQSRLPDGTELKAEVGVERPGAPFPTFEADQYPRPEGWEDHPGDDYAFSLRPILALFPFPPEERVERVWRSVRGHVERAVESRRRRIVGGPAMAEPSNAQWVVWVRTETNVRASA
jgi:hypothetical protein